MSKSYESVWESCSKVIKDNVPLKAFKTWFEPIVPINLENSVLTIQVTSHFFYEWLEEHYITLLRVALVKQLGPDAKLIYDVRMENNYSNSNPHTVKFEVC